MAKRKQSRPQPRKAPKGLSAAAILKAVDANSTRTQHRLNDRDSEAQQIDVRIPEDVLDFLEELYREPHLAAPDRSDLRTFGTRIAAILASLRDAYREGCRQGYIEGFIARRMPDKKRSATGNAAKRSLLVTLPDGTTMTRHERDAKMAAEYAGLVKLMKPTPAMQRLAGKYGFESWQGVRAALKKVEAGDRQ